MSSTSNGDRSAAEIEREVEATRARLTGTVEELKDRVSPGQLADQAMDWVRGSGGKEFAQNLGGAVRDNPIPVLLIAAGVGWLALGNRSGSSGRALPREETRYGAYEGSSDYAGGSYAGADYGVGEPYGNSTYGRSSGGPSLGDRASEAASDLKNRASGAASDIGERASGIAGTVRGTAADAANRVGEAASQAWNAATSTAQSVADSAASAGRRVADRASQAWSSTGSAQRYRYGDDDYGYAPRRGLSDVFEAQPLLMGAVGLALGAALGALFPASDTENRLLGETRDDVVNRAQALAGEAYEKAREFADEGASRLSEAAGEAYDRTKERLNESGLTPSAGASALGEVARDLREAVERTASEVAGSVREATDRPAGENPSGGSTTPRPTDRGPL